MANKSTNGSPATQACLELFPDPFDKLQDIKNRLTKWDERHRSLLSEAAQTEIELYARLTLPHPKALR
jgi:hypothetical protein